MFSHVISCLISRQPIFQFFCALLINVKEKLLDVGQTCDGVFLCRGAGQEVGRSCIILEFKGRKIMVKLLCVFTSAAHNKPCV